MSRLLASITVLSILLATTASAQQELTRFEVADAVFSPDGDGVQDTTSIFFRLSNPVLSVAAVVFEADSVTPVDTLLAPGPVGSGRTDMGWDGLDWTGAPVSDARYVVTLSVSTASGDTSVTRRLFVDTGAPSIQIESVTPNPYGPGAVGSPSELSIAITVAGTSPAYEGIPRDEIQWEFIRPAGTPIEPDSVRFDPLFEGADGSYQFLWRAVNQTGLSDGLYTVTMTILDQAGHASNSDHTFVIDSRAPEVKFVDPLSGRSFRNAPAEMYGWARDFSGIDTLTVRYYDGGPQTPVIVDAVSDDTTFFHAPLADSLDGEDTYGVVVRAVDKVKRPTTATLTVTIDRTAPGSPELDPFDGVWHTDTYRVTGTFPSGGGAAGRVRIYRNGVNVDTVLTATVERIDRSIDLLPGKNVITAIFVDGALNESAPSNALNIQFDDGSGLFVSAPMRPGSAFDVNLSRPGRYVELYIYDMTGDLVVLLEDDADTRNYSLAWNGRNGSGDLVKRGPLLAVASVVMEDGSRTTYRELFLFTPEAE